jgi:ribokinase
MSGRVIVVGSVNIDLVARVPALPHPGETVTGGSYERHHGGKGGNQAVAAARLRRPTLFIGALGDDSFEGEARRALASERVDVSMVASLPGQPTGMALILVDASGENEIAVVPGANGAIEDGYARDCLGRLGRLAGDVVLVCNEVPLHVVREALVCAHAAGATTILNPAPAIGIDRALLSLADIITPNRNELATLLSTQSHRAGSRTDDAREVAGRARPLIEDGAGGPGVRKAVIVTLGASGVVVLEREGSGLDGAAAAQAPAEAAAGATEAGDRAEGEGGGGAEAAAGAAQPPAAGEPLAGPTPAAPALASPAPAAPTPAGPAAIRVWEAPAEMVATIDSTGAGDAFNGALAAAIAEGRSLAEAVDRALVAGALATTRAGAREGMATAQELEEHLASR